MPTYRVIWEIDVDASSALSAVRQAREYQLDPSTTANYFEVHHRANGKRWSVDLSEPLGRQKHPMIPVACTCTYTHGVRHNADCPLDGKR